MSHLRARPPGLIGWLLLISLLSGLLVACRANPPVAIPASPPWTYTDLRLLNTRIDQCPSDRCLAAMYLRTVQGDEQVRLELLDITSDPDFDLYLALDTLPGGAPAASAPPRPVNLDPSFAWDMLLILPAHGPIQVVNTSGQPVPNLPVRIQRDPWMDTVTVSFHLSPELAPASPAPSRNPLSTGLLIPTLTPQPFQLFPSPVYPGRPYQVLAAITAPGGSQPLDTLGPASQAGAPPPRLPVLLALSGTLSADTPAQALRRWNGAHTGPFGVRHGLAQFLMAVQDTRFPAVLLDMAAPQPLASLSAVAGLQQVQRLQRQGLLSLPDTVPIQPAGPGQPITPAGWFMEAQLAYSHQLALANQLSDSRMFSSAFLPSSDLPGYDLAFVRSVAPAGEQNPLLTQPYRYRSYLAVPVPIFPAADSQATLTGPSIDLRRQLLSAAVLPADSGGIAVLGGELPSSAWGDVAAATLTLQYLKSRLWLRPVSGENLLSLPFNAPPKSPSSPGTGDMTYIPPTPQGKPSAAGLSSAQIQKALEDQLQALPPGPVTTAARQSYSALLTNNDYAHERPELAGSISQLRLNFLGQVGLLAQAASWAADPQAFFAHHGASSGSPFELDCDWDGQPEIVLASEDFFALLEPNGAYLALAFSRTDTGIHQVVGPAWQTGFPWSDPTEWNPSMGIAGDPSALRGAFSDTPAGVAAPTWDRFAYQGSPGQVTFTSPSGYVVKAYHLIPRGLQVDYNAQQSQQIQIALLVDPWQAIVPGWIDRYIAARTDSTWQFGVAALPGSSQYQVTIALDPPPASGSSGWNFAAFNDSRAALLQPENPNFSYPPGHFLPFSMALITGQGQGTFTFRLTAPGAVGRK